MPNKRFAARLMFYYEVENETSPFQTCEERISLLQALDAKSACQKFERYGKQAEHEYENDSGNTVHFRYLGIRELKCLDFLDADQVWYEIVDRKDPAARKEKFIPPVEELEAIRCEE